jgi:RimJ/RimL family protein N-acetyltransferase
MDLRRVFTYWKNDKLVGCVQFSDFYSGNSIMIHAAFHPAHRAAMNRKVMKQVFNFTFNILKVHRVNTYSILGLTDKVIKFILGMGFQEEGILREAVEFSGNKYDLVLYGMLREDCRWL